MCWGLYRELPDEAGEAPARYVLRRRYFADGAPSWVVTPRKDDCADTQTGSHRHSRLAVSGDWVRDT